MAKENKEKTAATVEPVAAEDNEKRGRSSIGFPYIDFSKAAAVAEKIHDKVGTSSCSAEQLAAWLDQSPKSSSFRYQVNVTRMFGLIEASDNLKLSELGLMLVDPKRKREARAKAFLKVPLFNALYEKFKSGVLPPAAALQVQIGELGVAQKQVVLARQVFERSADQTGYFESGKDRLVMPAFTPTDGTLAADKRRSSGGGGGGDVHPLIQRLLASLPETGSQWPVADRAKWLQTASSIFDQIYNPGSDQEGFINIEIWQL